VEAEGIAPEREPAPAPEPVGQASQSEISDSRAAASLVNAADASLGGVQGAAESDAPASRRVPPPPEHVLANQKVITQADPDRPKRGGWWQRAKATLTGGE